MASLPARPSATRPVHAARRAVAVGAALAAVAAGQLHAVGKALADHSPPAGSAEAWGCAFGRFVNNPSTPEQNCRTTPTPVSGVAGVVAPSDRRHRTLDADGLHSLAVMGGNVAAWGSGLNGQLGNGASGPSNLSASAVTVVGLDGVVSVAAGMNHSLALRADGTVWAWGQGDFGQVGNPQAVAGRMSQRLQSGQVPPDGIVVTPVPVSSPDDPSLSLTGVRGISAGNLHSVALKGDGSLWAWGSNDSGQLGIGVVGGIVHLPVRVLLDGRAVAVSAGGGHTLALLEDGRVFAWGRNGSGQSGRPFGLPSPAPTLMGFPDMGVPNEVKGLPAGSTVVDVAAGDSTSFALMADGTVWGWGRGDQGQLGNRSVVLSRQPDPVQVKRAIDGDPAHDLPLTGVRAVAAGGEHALVLRSDATVWGWGKNNLGQLAQSNTTPQGGIFTTAVAVSGLHGSVAAVAAGRYHSAAVFGDPQDLPPITLEPGQGLVPGTPTTTGLSVSDVSATEGNAGTTNATFTVTLLPAATSTVTVNYATANATATAPADYTATSGTLSFAAGETTKTVSVPVVGDSVIEPDETFSLDLSGPTGATLADSQGIATIVNDDFAQGLFRPLSSARIFGPAALGETASVDVQVTGAGGVPASGVSGVALSVTVANPSQASFLTVWPTGATRPTVSSLNWTAGETVANAVQVKVGTGGKVSLYNQWGTAPVTVDVVGWYTDETTTSPGGRYNAVVPSRILDSRDGTGGVPPAPLVASPTCASPTSVKVTGANTALGEVAASAVVVNLTVTPSSGEHTTGSGALVAWPAGEAVPVGSNVPYDLSRPSKRTVPTLAVTKVGTGGYVNVCNRAPAGSAAMHAIADVQGWYSLQTTAGPGARLVPITPERFLDTRNPLFLNVTGRSSPDKLTAPEILDLQVTGRGEVPAEGVAAVVMNVTVTEPSADSFMVVWPTGTPIPVQSHAVPGQQVPEASTLNFVAGQNVPNLVIVPVGLDGKVSFYNAHGGTHVIADVVGWFASP